jgi:hypothetical protein
VRITRIDHEDYYEEIYDPNLPQHHDPGWPEPAHEARRGLTGEVVMWIAPNRG